MLKGFKEFLFRGNIVDLAIAVVIGTAFTALVTAVVTNIINPLIASIGSAQVGGLGFSVRHNADGTGTDATFLNFGNVITAVVNFVVIAAVVYFALVVPMKRLMALRARHDAPADEPEVAPSEDVLLLRQIRDLLSAGVPATAAADTGTDRLDT